ncbi:hypothetical protein [Actinokineospora enzanensis]|uniref:hypothetical protein n=1 Tax=Actinokineospora enzanensis TaxID=155975 RepID=UPI0003801365|nr:hypothetical protein [Actinokineospora enzanensis]
MSSTENGRRDEFQPPAASDRFRKWCARHYARSSGQQWRVISWMCWTVVAVAIGVGPMALLLLADLPIFGVVWFAVAVLAVAWVAPATLDWIEAAIPGPVRRDEYALLLPDHAEFRSVPTTRLHKAIVGHVAAVHHADGGSLRWWFAPDPDDTQPPNPLADAVLERFVQRSWDRVGEGSPVGGFRGPVVVTLRPGLYGNLGLSRAAREALDTLVAVYMTGELPPGALTREEMLAQLINGLTAAAERVGQSTIDTSSPKRGDQR